MRNPVLVAFSFGCVKGEKTLKPGVCLPIHGVFPCVGGVQIREQNERIRSGPRLDARTQGEGVDDPSLLGIQKGEALFLVVSQFFGGALKGVSQTLRESAVSFMRLQKVTQVKAH